MVGAGTFTAVQTDLVTDGRVAHRALPPRGTQAMAASGVDFTASTIEAVLDAVSCDFRNQTSGMYQDDFTEMN